jgi:hypothetical protein
MGPFTRVVFAATSIVVAIHEEFLFRGIMQTLTAKRWGTLKAIGITSTAMTVWHVGALPLNVFNFWQVFAISCILGLIYAATQSILLVVALHALYDASWSATPVLPSPLVWHWGSLLLLAALMLLTWLWVRSAYWPNPALQGALRDKAARRPWPCTLSKKTMKSLFSTVSQKQVAAIFMLLMLSWQASSANQVALIGHSADVYRQAQSGRWFAEAAKLSPDVLPTSDDQSFVVAWRAPGTDPKRWIVSLHGSRGFATDDLAIWHPLLRDRDVGLLSVQWWIGTDDLSRSYYAPLQIYREIDIALRKLGVQPGMAMLHGFSRGSANSYAVAAIDAGRGRRH